MSIFNELIKDIMDDFLVFGDSFNTCHNNLDRVISSCEETNLILSWEKCHFMVQENFPPPLSVKAVRSILGHACFYRSFIKDFSKITRHLTKLLEKDTPFDFSNDYVQAFNMLKNKLTNAL